MSQFPRSEFAVPTSSFNAPVPAPSTNPDSGPQATIRVSCEWLKYIRGALTQLLLQTTWQGDEATVELAQTRANVLISLFLGNNPGDCGSELPQPEGCDCEDDMSNCSLNCDCHGVITVKCPDGEIYTLQTSPVPGGQPGPTPAPAANGGTQETCYAMTPSDKRLIPARLNSGDTILISKLLGAWQDTREANWNCPDGYVFALDACGGPVPPHGSPDPLPTAMHMALIIQIAGSYYDVLNLSSSGSPQTFTVPPGIVNEQGTLLVNTDSPAQTTGEATFCVDVTNNQMGTWTHVFDFTSNPAPFAPNPATIGTAAVWTPGTGWTDTPWQDPANNYYEGVFLVNPDVAGSYQITDIELTYNEASPHTTPGSGDNAVGIVAHSGAAIYVTFGALADGANQTLFLTGLAETHADMQIFVASAYHIGSAPAGGACAAVSVKVSGTGVDPF
jgi:hypothetical protein